MTIDFKTANLDAFLGKYQEKTREEILRVDPKSTRSVLDLSLLTFRTDLATALLEDVNATSDVPLPESELDGFRSGLYDIRTEEDFVKSNLNWVLDDSGALSLVDAPGSGQSIAWTHLVDSKYYPTLAALTLVFEEAKEGGVELEMVKAPADVRVALEGLADASFLQLMRAEILRVETQKVAKDARVGLLAALWGHVDVFALARADDLAVETYLSLPELERFQAHVIMEYLVDDQSAFKADPRVAALDSEFKKSALGTAVTFSQKSHLETFDDLMKVTTERYVEHQAYATDPVSYLDADDANLARRRALAIDASILAGRILAKFPTPSPTSGVTAERYAWVHTQGEAGATSVDIKDVFHSIPSPYRALLMRNASTAKITKTYNDVLTGKV